MSTKYAEIGRVGKNEPYNQTAIIVLKQILNKKSLFSRCKGVQILLFLVTDSLGKLQFLERLHHFIKILRYKMYVQFKRKYIAFFCHCTETRHFIDSWCVRRVVASKGIGGD